MQSNGEAERRKYWQNQMDRALKFMKAVLDVPIEETFEPLLSIQEVAKSANVELEMSEKKHEGQLPRPPYLRATLAEDLISVARDFNQMGFVLRVEDCFRSREIQSSLFKSPRVLDTVIRKVIWELGETRPPGQFIYQRLSVLCATVPKTGTHMGGTAVDVSILDRSTGNELDRGASYLELSELTPMESPFVSETARHNRRQITEVFKRHGFVAYPFEFWHYSKGDVYDALLNRRMAPARYGPVEIDPSSGELLSPIDDPEAPLESVESIIQLIEQRLEIILLER